VITVSGLLRPVVVPEEFCRDWTLPPLAYALLIRLATAEPGSIKTVDEAAPGVADSDVADAVDLLIERGHLLRRSDGVVTLRLARSDRMECAKKSPVAPEVSHNVCALYRWFDANRILLYVGITKNPKQRFKAHAKSARWYTLAVGGPTIEWLPSRAAAVKAETLAIIKEEPIFNRNPDNRDGVERNLRKYLEGIGRPDLMPTEYVNASSATRHPRRGTPEWARRYGKYMDGPT
jgi:predicted GIY-YIG superfamily endonuclease